MGSPRDRDHRGPASRDPGMALRHRRRGDPLCGEPMGAAQGAPLQAAEPEVRAHLAPGARLAQGTTPRAPDEGGRQDESQDKRHGRALTSPVPQSIWRRRNVGMSKMSSRGSRMLMRLTPYP